MILKKIILTLSILISICFTSCGQSDCQELPSTFSSYSEAVTKIKSATFKIKESINTSKSSWIRGLTFFSCTGTSGFLIMKTDEKEYVHKDVPYSIWTNFKNAPSFGSYYNHHIKHKYHLYISQL